MKFSEDERAWKRVGYGVLLVATSPLWMPIGLITILFYSIGKSFDEHMTKEDAPK